MVVVAATSLTGITPAAVPIASAETSEPEDEVVCAVVEFEEGTRLIANSEKSLVSSEVVVDIPDGGYRIELRYRDQAHLRPGQGNQKNEQWLLEGLDGDGHVVFTTEPTDDLPKKDLNGITDVGDYLLTGVVSLRARHAVPGKKPNSIEPISAVFISPTCRPGTLPRCQIISLGNQRLIDSKDRKAGVGTPIDIALFNGKYEIVLESSDSAHGDNQPSQPNEQWLLEGLDRKGKVVFSTTPTDDLPDAATTNETNVGTVTAVSVVAIRARHARLGSGPDSIEPVSATFVNRLCSPDGSGNGMFPELEPDPDDVQPVDYQEDDVPPLIRKPPVAAEAPPVGEGLSAEVAAEEAMLVGADLSVAMDDSMTRLEVDVARELSPFGVAMIVDHTEMSALIAASDATAAESPSVTVDVGPIRRSLNEEVLSRLRLDLHRDCSMSGLSVSCESRMRLDGDLEPGGETLVASLASAQPETERAVLSAVFDRDASQVMGAALEVASAAAGFDLVTLQTSESSEAGDYQAAPIARVQEFDVGLQTGALQNTQSIPVPASAAGPAPQVGLSYYSQAVDGLTNSINPQAGPIGVGWSLNDAAITRSTPGGCQVEAVGDSCFTEYYSISLNGVSSQLVPLEPGGNEYRLQNEAFFRVIRHDEPLVEDLGRQVPGIDSTGEWWEVFTPDGNRHLLGITKDSVDWMPLYHPTGTDLPDRCVNYRTDGSEVDGTDVRLCTRAYRWHLSSVMDRAQNEVRYHYGQEFNDYFARGAFEGVGQLRYVRASRIEEISYTHHPDMDQANARVRFNWEWRCGTTETFSGFGCDGTNAWPQQFPDTPPDFDCEGINQAGCLNTDRQSPTFWSQLRLGSISTQVWAEGDRYHTTATHDLVQGFPDADDHRGDWINDYADVVAGTNAPKPALYRLHERPGGTYQHWGNGQIEVEDHDMAVNTTIDGIGRPILDVGGGFSSGPLEADQGVGFTGVRFGEGGAAPTSIHLRAASSSPGTVAMRSGGADGPVLATFAVDSGGEDQWVTVSSQVTAAPAAIDDVFLTVESGVVDLNWIRPEVEGFEAFLELPSLQPTEFLDSDTHFAWLPNRVNPVVSPLVFPRIERVINSFGGVTTFTYGQPENLRCGEPRVWSGRNGGELEPEVPATAGRDDESLCYAAFGTDINPDIPNDDDADSGFVLWHRWVVTEAESDDPYNDNDDRITTYDYGQPRWSRPLDPTLWDEDLGLCATKAFNDFRGFDQTTVTTFTRPQGSDEPTPVRQTRHKFFQGLDLEPRGDLACDLVAGTANRSISYTSGDTVADSLWLRGRSYEIEDLDPSNGEVQERRETTYDLKSNAPTSDDPAIRRFVFSSEERTYFEPDGVNLQTRAVHEYDDLGHRIKTTNFGDVATPDDDARTEITYDDPDLNRWLLGAKVSEIVTDLEGDDAGVVSRTEWTYDNNERLRTTRSFASGTESSTITVESYDSQNRPTATSDPLDRRSETSYDPNHGFIATTRNHLTPAWEETTAYSPLLKPSTFTNHAGETNHMVYDEYNRLERVWLFPRTPTNNPDTPSMEFVYGDEGTETKGLLWVRTRTLFDDQDEPQYLESTSYFDGFGREIQTDNESPADPELRTVVNRTYDALARVTRESAPFDEPVATEALDNNWATVDSHTATTFFADGRRQTDSLLGAGLTDRGTSTYSYDGLTETTLDPNGSRIDRILDGSGRTDHLVEWVSADGEGPAEPQTTRFRYDVADRLVEINPPGEGDDGSETSDIISYTYDLMGRRLSVDDPNRGLETMVYDPVGRITDTDGARGDDNGDGLDDDRLSYTYDEVDNLTELAIGPNPLATHTYQLRPGDVPGAPDFALGQQITATAFDYDPSAGQSTPTATVTTTDWDDHHRPITTETTVAGETFSQTTNLLEDGAVQSLVYPDGDTINYRYNHAGLPVAAAGLDAGFAVALTTYDFAGRVVEQNMGRGGVNRTFDYDPGTLRLRRAMAGFDDGDPNTPDTWQLQHQRFSYDLAGNITNIRDFRNPAPLDSGGQNLCYRYDELDRLVRAWTNIELPDTSCDDDVANRVGPVSADAATTYDQRWRYDGDGDISEFTFSDDEGLGSTTWSYDYQSTEPGTGGPNAVHRITNEAGASVFDATYDQAGNLTARTTTDGTQQLTYDEAGRLEQVTDPGGTTSYTYGPTGDRVTQTVNGETTIYIGNEYETRAGNITKYYFFGGEMLALDRNGLLNYVITDHVSGSNAFHNPDDTAAVTDVQRRRYQPFGQLRGAASLPGDTPTDIGFTGQRLDSTGLMYFQTRYYDPLIGRFTQADTIVPGLDAVTINRYAYTGNNPIGRTDPTGQCFGIGWCEDAADAVGDVAGAAVDVVSDTASTVRDATVAAVDATAGFVKDNWVEIGVGIAAGIGCGLAVAAAVGTAGAASPLAVIGCGAAAGAIGGIAGNASRGETGWDLLDGVHYDALAGGLFAGAGRAVAPLLGRALGPVSQRLFNPFSSFVRNSRFGQYIGNSVVGNTFRRFTTFTRNGGYWGKPSSSPRTFATTDPGRTFTHFTDEAGAVGITGTRPLAVGESTKVGSLTFGKGRNNFLANQPGDIFVTDLPSDASSLQLSGIGVFGSRQQYAISFSEADAFASGAIVRGAVPGRGIFTIPGGCSIIGTCSVARVR